MRQSVMSAGDQEALWAWLQTPSGTTDLAAWQRLLANLPVPGSPPQPGGVADRAAARRRRSSDGELRTRPACNACVTPTRPGVGYCRIRSRSGPPPPGARRPAERGAGSVPGDSARVLTARPSLHPAAASAPRDRSCGSSRSCSSSPTGVRADEVAKDARQERLDRVLPAHQPVRGGLRGPREQGRLPPGPRARGADRRRRRARPPGPVHDGLAGDRRRAVPAHPQALLPRRGRPAGSRSSPSAAARASRGCPAWARRSATAPTPWRWARWCCRCWRPARWPATWRAG